jgi:hypothetical protein
MLLAAGIGCKGVHLMIFGMRDSAKLHIFSFLIG